MSNLNLKVATRTSALAMAQVEIVLSHFTKVNFELINIKSFGDINKQLSLLENQPADFFTRELDQALQQGNVDIAIHSAKDLPYPLASDLELIALLEATDQTDALVSKNQLTLEQLPLQARIGTSSLTRRRQVLADRPDLKIVAVRGTIEERIAEVENGNIDALIVASCALKRLHLSAHITQVLRFETHPLQGHIAVVARRNSKDLKNKFAPLDSRKNWGKVTLVGFGPGNPDLLTLAAEKCIAQADSIFYDDLIDKDFLIKYKAKKVYVGKRKGAHSNEQQQINRLLLDEAKLGSKVVRLKGGDPLIFAHGGEELEYLKSNFVEVDVIPGITTALALAALTQIPLTHRNIASSVSFVSGQAAQINFPNSDTVVCYMAGFNIAKVAAQAIANGKNPKTPVLLVANVSTSAQSEFQSDLETLSTETRIFPTPIIAIIGNVVALRYQTENAVKRPNYLVTGTQKEHYEQLGTVIHQPLIQIEAIWPNTPLEIEINRLANYHWLFFTSRYTVDFFFEALEKFDKDARHLAGLKIASVGRITSLALKSHGIIPEIQASEESSIGLLKDFETNNIPVGKVLIPRSDIGLPVLPEGLKKIGWDVATVSVYNNTYPKNLEPLDLSDITNIVFSSPSCVTNFLRLYGKFPENKNYIFRGKETEKRFNSSSLLGY
ncbi:MAG: hypothetical protein AUK44_06700 [Porphyromonadaceae bacterium CG2_30_38_12]|nr:MAG: hypothetical protein AUK44_06700 [Porphyromonadaceae bacterium CG2_30_38_12]